MTPRGLLKDFYLCRGMAPDDLAVIEACAERKHCTPGELIFREGEEAEAIYFVELGTVEIVKAEGGITALVTLGSGGGFGEIASLIAASGPRPRVPAKLVRSSGFRSPR